jgi:hypothetical protein
MFVAPSVLREAVALCRVSRQVILSSVANRARVSAIEYSCYLLCGTV